MASAALRFVKALAYASQTPQEKTEEKQELIQQIQTVKTLIKSPKKHKSRIAKELSRLERQLEKVVVIEHQLLRQNHSESSELKNQLKDLRLKLSLVHSGALKHQMDRLLFLIGEVGARVDNYVSMKERHTKRMTTIEQSLKKSISPLNTRVSHLEHNIGQIEHHYDTLKKRQALTKEQQTLFEARLSKLRQSLHKERVNQLDKHRDIIHKSFTQSRKKHTFLSVPPQILQIKQFPLSLPSPEQVRQEEAEETHHLEIPSLPPVERPPEHRMIFSPLPSISGRNIGKTPVPKQQASSSHSVTVAPPSPPPSEQQSAAAPFPDIDLSAPAAPSFEGKEEELLSMLESELFPQQQKPKKTFFQKLIGK